MEWLLTVLIITTQKDSPFPHLTVERLTGIEKLETCLRVGFYTRAALLQPGFRLPSESLGLINEPIGREVIINCQAVRPA